MENEEIKVMLESQGFEGVALFENFDYSDAFIGVSIDDRAVYDYDKMVEWLIEKQGFTTEEAVEWIDYNTIRALPYCGEKAPIIVYGIKN